ncbi:glutaredoxin-related protein [Anaerotaenia torta]|uniref:hypothetical protein n=1 Tax=Anaerotaenia torta TaxID=433293 RepID=UPI003D1CDCA6
MKVIMYGTGICPDCVEAKEILEKQPEIELDYRDITRDIKTLKEFLAFRDHDSLFGPVIQEGRVGIPFFQLEDGTKTFETSDIIGGCSVGNPVSSCSVDGKGHC